MLVVSSLSRNATQAMVLSLVFKHCISSRPAPRKQPLEPPESVKSSSKYVAYSGTFKPRTTNSNAKSAAQKDSEPGQKGSVDAEAESGNVGTAIQKANQHRMIEETKRR